MITRVKICGITNREDAAMVVEAGADALGFVFVPGTPRVVSAESAADIVRQLPPFITRVGLFADEEAGRVHDVLGQTGIETVQFHGDESPEYCRSFRDRVRVVKAFRIRGPETLERMSDYTGSVDAFLLDAWAPGALGGTGIRFDWSLMMGGRPRGAPLVLAGGLNPENVAEAVRRVRPFAVDVSSGVERAPGKKDPSKVCEFVQAVKAV